MTQQPREKTPVKASELNELAVLLRFYAESFDEIAAKMTDNDVEVILVSGAASVDAATDRIEAHIKSCSSYTSALLKTPPKPAYLKTRGQSSKKTVPRKSKGI